MRVIARAVAPTDSGARGRFFQLCGESLKTKARNEVKKLRILQTSDVRTSFLPKICRKTQELSQEVIPTQLKQSKCGQSLSRSQVEGKAICLREILVTVYLGWLCSDGVAGPHSLQGGWPWSGTGGLEPCRFTYMRIWFSKRNTVLGVYFLFLLIFLLTFAFLQLPLL